ncbi:hypothetical protein AVEN_170558-1, partial [Araneus ventricosus]
VVVALGRLPSSGMKDAGTRPDSTEDPPVCWPVHMKSVMDQTSLDWCGSRRKPAQNPQLKIMKFAPI